MIAPRYQKGKDSTFDMTRRRLGTQPKVYQHNIEFCLVGTIWTLGRVHILLLEELGLESQGISKEEEDQVLNSLRSEYHRHSQCCPAHTVINQLHSRTEVYKQQPAGLTWPAASFCMAHRPKRVITFLVFKKSSKGIFFVTQENAISIDKILLDHSYAYLSAYCL